MKICQSGINTSYNSDAVLRDCIGRRSLKGVDPDRLAGYLSDTAYRWLGCVKQYEDIPRFQDFCRAATGKGDDFRVGILNAHGTYLSGEWCYEDGIFRRSVQKWIDKNEEKFDLILLSVCNPRNAKPIVRKSMAVIPSDDVSSLPRHVYDVDHSLVMPDGQILPLNRDFRNRLTHGLEEMK